MEPSLQPPQDYCIITAILLECQTSPTTLLIGARVFMARFISPIIARWRVQRPKWLVLWTLDQEVQV